MSVVVPVRDGARTIASCLDALAAQVGAPTFEVVVVDNGSRDGTAAVARRHPLGPRVVDEPRRGSYAARNAGIAVARGRVIAFTDADCRPAGAWLAAGARDDVMVGGRIDITLPRQPSSWARYDAAMYLDQRHFVEVDGFAATANLFVPAAVFAAVGPFDAALVSSGDVELCRRAVAAGHRLVYADDAVVEHPPRATLVDTWRLHRRLGAGWAQLARRGLRPSPWRDPGLRIDLGTVASTDRRRALAVPHAIAMTARWTGRLTGRG